MLVFLYSPDPCPDLKKSLDSDADPIGKGLDPVKGGISRFKNPDPDLVLDSRIRLKIISDIIHTS